MSSPFRAAVLTPLVIILLTAPSLVAQPEDDGKLYNPPTIEMEEWL